MLCASRAAVAVASLYEGLVFNAFESVNMVRLPLGADAVDDSLVPQAALSVLALGAPCSTLAPFAYAQTLGNSSSAVNVTLAPPAACDVRALSSGAAPMPACLLTWPHAPMRSGSRVSVGFASASLPESVWYAVSTFTANSSASSAQGPLLDGASALSCAALVPSRLNRLHNEPFDTQFVFSRSSTACADGTCNASVVACAPGASARVSIGGVRRRPRRAEERRCCACVAWARARWCACVLLCSVHVCVCVCVPPARHGDTNASAQQLLVQCDYEMLSGLRCPIASAVAFAADATVGYECVSSPPTSPPAWTLSVDVAPHARASAVYVASNSFVFLATRIAGYAGSALAAHAVLRLLFRRLTLTMMLRGFVVGLFASVLAPPLTLTLHGDMQIGALLSVSFCSFVGLLAIESFAATSMTSGALSVEMIELLTLALGVLAVVALFCAAALRAARDRAAAQSHAAGERRSLLRSSAAASAVTVFDEASEGKDARRQSAMLDVVGDDGDRPKEAHDADDASAGSGTRPLAATVAVSMLLPVLGGFALLTRLVLLRGTDLLCDVVATACTTLWMVAIILAALLLGANAPSDATTVLPLVACVIALLVVVAMLVVVGAEHAQLPRGSRNAGAAADDDGGGDARISDGGARAVLRAIALGILLPGLWTLLYLVIVARRARRGADERSWAEHVRTALPVWHAALSALGSGVTLLVLGALGFAGALPLDPGAVTGPAAALLSCCIICALAGLLALASLLRHGDVTRAGVRRAALLTLLLPVVSVVWRAVGDARARLRHPSTDAALLALAHAFALLLAAAAALCALVALMLQAVPASQLAADSVAVAVLASAVWGALSLTLLAPSFGVGVCRPLDDDAAPAAS